MCKKPVELEMVDDKLHDSEFGIYIRTILSL